MASIHGECRLLMVMAKRSSLYMAFVFDNPRPVCARNVLISCSCYIVNIYGCDGVCSSFASSRPPLLLWETTEKASLAGVLSAMNNWCCI